MATTTAGARVLATPVAGARTRIMLRTLFTAPPLVAVAARWDDPA